MLIEVDAKTYYGLFQDNPHPYISSGFIELNKGKADKIVYLVESESKSSVGLVAGIKNKILKSPFSAPFGGFHFRKDNQYINEIESFVLKLMDYGIQNHLEKIEITLAPDIYQLSFNSKCVNILIRKGFKFEIPEITNWLDLESFSGSFSNKGARKYYNQAVRNHLRFEVLKDQKSQQDGFNIICENRTRYGRPIFMSYQDIIDTSNLWPVDFFGIFGLSNTIIAAGVFYRGQSSIVQGVFWGDSEIGRPLRAIDFLSYNIWNFYKNNGCKIIDLGISTEEGIPNEGLLRFKESHNCNSSLRFTFTWENKNLND